MSAKRQNIMIDGREISVSAGMTVFQACQEIGIEIPHFCFHERLSIAGNCRMCLVEMEGSPKPIASCAMPVVDKMVIRTGSEMVREARRGVLEFLLINHPLDCPICDQGGECDLQDLAMSYGQFESRFKENKRSVEEKEFGPLIKTEMTRCIHCTRCVRFATEVAGVEELGATGRGENMEVGTYVQKALGSELSGNMIDLCPVGALNSRPYSLQARAWEMDKTQSIDVMDAVGSNIRVDSFRSRVMRVLPSVCEDINEEWISDKTRFSYDALNLQRLDRPWHRRQGRLHEIDWPEALSVAATKLQSTAPEKIGAIAGDLCCLESMLALKDLMDALGTPHKDCRQDGAQLQGGIRASYLFNTTIAGIEQADACLMIGSNPRIEASIINARLRKRAVMGDFPAASIGPSQDLNWPVEMIGDDPRVLETMASGSHPFMRKLKKAQRPMVIIGMGALQRPDALGILRAVARIADKTGMITPDWNGFNILHCAAARVGGMDIGFLPDKGGMDTMSMVQAAQSGMLDVLWLLGADDWPGGDALGKSFVIYQGHHGDRGAQRADLILPGAAYTEKNATYVNTEGRRQNAMRAVMPPGMAREDWTIIRALANKIGTKKLRESLPYNDIFQLRARIEEVSTAPAKTDAAWLDSLGDTMPIQKTGFNLPVADFYLSNVISRCSPTMAQCSRVFHNQNGKSQ